MFMFCRARNLSGFRSFKRRPLSSLAKSTPPQHARVVVVGGGIIGCSTAYHLGKLGWEVVVLEQGTLTCGTTWHAAGLVGQLRKTKNETEIFGKYAVDLYTQLEEETGRNTGWKNCGSIGVATTKERMEMFHRQAANARLSGIEAHMISPLEAQKMWPLLNIEDVIGAIYIPGDGTVMASDLCMAYVKGAEMNGCKFFEGVDVLDINYDSKGVTGVETNLGPISSEVVINCTGQWGRQTGDLCDVNVPLHPHEHYYIYSKALDPPVPSMLPSMRSPDNRVYFREWTGGLLTGGFESKSKPCFEEGPPKNFQFQLFSDDWDQFEELMNGALVRVPALAEGEVKMTCGPESFTTDGQCVLGESATLRRFYVSAGFNSLGIVSSAGAGKVLADWVVNDKPMVDLSFCDVNRFATWHNNTALLRDRSQETINSFYRIAWPKEEWTSIRNLRRSSLHDKLAASGAVFGSVFGWERPNWYAPSGIKPEHQYSYTKPNWMEHTRQEHLACRSGVGLVDESSVGKLSIGGRDSCSLLQRLCVNDMDIDVGCAVRTPLVNFRGDLEADVTVIRTSKTSFLLLCHPEKPVSDLIWIQKQIQESEVAVVIDTTSSFAVISLIGPKAAELLQKVTAKIQTLDFEPNSSREIDIGYSRGRALFRTRFGDAPCYSLIIPTEFAASAFEFLMEHEQDSELKLVGNFALESLRAESGERKIWSHDLDPLNYKPLGNVQLKSHNFVGKEALQQIISQQDYDRTVRLLFDECATETEFSPLVCGGEPILCDGEYVGSLTCGEFGYSINRAVGLAEIRKTYGSGSLEKVELHVEIGGEKVKVVANEVAI